MNSLIRLCVGRPVTVIMAIMALFLAGFFSINMLSLDKLPEISYPRVTVETIYSGMGAKDVRSIITIPVEDALSSVKGLERIRSISRDGASVVVLDFKWGVDPNSASVLVREAIDAVYPSLPEGILKPIVVPGDPNEEPHAIISVASRLDDGSFARNLAEYELRARFRRIDGVGAVILVGGEIPEAKVKLDVPRALPRGIGAGELAQVMASETADIPAGNAREGDMELVVISSGRPNSVEELSHLILPTETGPLHISDIATISQETARRNSVFLFNNKEQVALEIYRRSGADPVKLSKEIKKTLDETIPVFSRDAEIKLVYDTSGDILKGIHDLARSALLGATAVFLTLLFFIRSIRYSLLTALSIPISAAAAITMLAITGKSLNSMSLSGLALGIGLVSDTSVVVLDLLHRTFDNYSKRPLPAEIGDCVSSVSGSSFASTVTTAVVFIPIVFLPGPLGALFGDMSISLVSSIAAGWLFAQLGLPSLYRIFYKKGKKETKIFKFEQIYDHGLKISMQRPFAILFIAIFLSIIGIAILFTRPASFVSPDDATEIEVAISFPPGTDLKYVGNNGILILKILNQFTWIETMFARSGAENEDINRRADVDYRKEQLLFRCMLKKGIKEENLFEQIHTAIEGVLPSDVKISIRYPQDRTERLLGLSSSYTTAVKGNDVEEVENRVDLVVGKLKKDASALISEYLLRPSGTRPELRIFPDREAAALLGVSAAQIAEVVNATTEGLLASRFEIEGRPLEVRVSGKFNEYQKSESMLEAIPISMSQNGPIFLGAVSKVERKDSEAALARLDRSDVTYLDIVPIQGKGSKLLKYIEEISKTISGISRADESAFSRYKNSLIITVFLVLMLLYMTMGAQFESFILPVILMITIPFSLAGAGPILLLINAGLDSGSVLGLVVLFGLVVNNGIVLYERSREKFLQGLSASEAVYSGAKDRLRPVLATTFTTFFALLPVVLSPLGATQRSMAAAMLGGVVASTFLTLFAIPPIFVSFIKRGKL